VLGKHGRNIIEETLLGSVTKHVLAESSCDVVVSAKPSAPFSASASPAA
jgi:nucleotide-binding universal stress UspA family protein